VRFTLPTPIPLRRLAAALLLSTLVGCAEEPIGVADGFSGPGFGAGFVIRDMGLTYRRLVGAEALQFDLTIASPAGRFIKAYGLKTPYEETERPSSPGVPMAVRDGKVYLKLASFTEIPRAGDYPFEIWLINEAGMASNRVKSSVYVQ
jgi:hypothetical protein